MMWRVMRCNSRMWRRRPKIRSKRKLRTHPSSGKRWDTVQHADDDDSLDCTVGHDDVDGELDDMSHILLMFLCQLWNPVCWPFLDNLRRCRYYQNCQHCFH